MPLFDESLRHYRELADHGFALPDEPHGVLMLAESEAELASELAALRSAFGELRAEGLAPGEPAALEPAVAPSLAGVRLHTGYPVGPATATRAFAARATAAGARLVTGAEVTLDPRRRDRRRRPPCGRRGRRRGRPVDARAGRPVRRLAPDRAAVGRRRRGPPGGAAAAHARGGGHPVKPASPAHAGQAAARRARRRAAADLQPRHDRRRVGARLDVPARASECGRDRAAAARTRRPLRPGARPCADGRRARLRAAALGRRAAAARPRAGARRRLRRRGTRALGRIAGPGVGAARGRSRAGPCRRPCRRRSTPAGSTRPARRTNDVFPTARTQARIAP